MLNLIAQNKAASLIITQVCTDLHTMDRSCFFWRRHEFLCRSYNNLNQTRLKNKELLKEDEGKMLVWWSILFYASFQWQSCAPPCSHVHWLKAFLSLETMQPTFCCCFLRQIKSKLVSVSLSRKKQLSLMRSPIKSTKRNYQDFNYFILMTVLIMLMTVLVLKSGISLLNFNQRQPKIIHFITFIQKHASKTLQPLQSQ